VIRRFLQGYRKLHWVAAGIGNAKINGSLKFIPVKRTKGIAMIELNPIRQSIAELSQRLATLRGYL